MYYIFHKCDDSVATFIARGTSFSLAVARTLKNKEYKAVNEKAEIS